MRRFWEFLLSIVSIAAAAVIIVYVMQNWTKTIEQQSLPVPVADIPSGTILTASMFSVRDVPRGVSSGYAESVNDLVGRVSLSLIPAQLPVPLSLTTTVDQYRLAPGNLVVLSVPITPEMAVGGKIRTGEHVDIWRIRPGTTVAEAIAQSQNSTITPVPSETIRIAQNILVVDVLDAGGQRIDPFAPPPVSSSTSSSASRVIHILVLALSPQDSEAVLSLMGDVKSQMLMWITLSQVS